VKTACLPSNHAPP